MKRLLDSKAWVESQDPAEVASSFTGEVMLVDDLTKSYYLVTLQDRDGNYITNLGEFRRAFQ